MWLEVGETDDIMVDAMYQEPQCGRGMMWLEVLKESGCGWR